MPNYLWIDIQHVKSVLRWPIMYLTATSAPVRRFQCLFWPRKWIPCPNFAIVSYATFILNFLLLRARGHLRRLIFWAHIFFQEYQDKCSSAFNEVNIDLLSKKSYFYKKHACARTFAYIRSKPKNACNIHNFKLACKKSAS